ncbi:MAG: zinc-ribbon and DUF3426 domain-containing protein [Methylotenera sp.]
MNYITSCPACETQFLLNKEHLKAHRGKVQCGHCKHIFNAKNRLTEIADDIQSAAEYNASIEVQASEATQAIDEKPISEVLNVVLGSVPNLEDLEYKNLESSAESGDYYISETIVGAEPEIIDAYDADQIQTPIIIEDFATDPKFLTRETKLNVWLVLLSLLLAVLAGLQAVYFLRTTIAADYPQFKPYLVQACAALKCEVKLPKNLDLLTIDDSDMQEDEHYEDVIRFSSLLINNASHALAYPNVELTLTDTAEQPVLRRLIKPGDYLPANANVASGIGSREEVRINLAINVKDIAVAGYRVLLVY